MWARSAENSRKIGREKQKINGKTRNKRKNSKIFACGALITVINSICIQTEKNAARRAAKFFGVKIRALGRSRKPIGLAQSRKKFRLRKKNYRSGFGNIPNYTLSPEGTDFSDPGPQKHCFAPRSRDSAGSAAVRPRA